VLQGTRKQVSSLEAQLRAANEQLAKLTSGQSVTGTNAVPTPGQTQSEANAAATAALTDEQLEKLKESLPEDLGNAITAIVQSSRQTAQQLQEVREREAENRRQEDARRASAVQEAIDANPALALWQSNDPVKWEEAKATDALLKAHPVWGQKSLHERFAEVIRRVDPSAQPAPTPAPSAQTASLAAQAAKVIAAKTQGKAAVPITHSDLPAGTAPAQSEQQRAESMDNSALEKLFSGAKNLDDVSALLAKFG
jgi:hypothetical protein